MKVTLAIIPFLLASSIAQASTAQFCSAKLSNTTISFNLVQGQVDSQSIHFASPRTPSKNMSSDLELELNLGEKDHQGLLMVKTAVNIEKYEAAKAEGLEFPILPPCECMPMPSDFDHTMYELFSQGEVTLLFECSGSGPKTRPL